MNKKTMGRLQLPVLCLVLGFTSACSTVTPEQLSAVEAKATSALSDARKAASDAAPPEDAQTAQAASAAQATADSAKSTAKRHGLLQREQDRIDGCSKR